MILKKKVFVILHIYIQIVLTKSIQIHLKEILIKTACYHTIPIDRYIQLMITCPDMVNSKTPLQRLKGPYFFSDLDLKAWKKSTSYFSPTG